MIITGPAKAIPVNQAVLDLLRARHIYDKRSGGPRWRVGDILVVPPDVITIEPYVHIFGGSCLPRAMGAFSYAQGRLQPAFAIGRYCSLAEGVVAMGAAHPTEWAPTSPMFFDAKIMPGLRAYLVDERHQTSFKGYRYDDTIPTITVGDDVWIGTDAMIKGGVTIGDGAVVGARSVVTKDVPPYAVVAGAPARLVRMRFGDAMIERFLALQPFRFGPDDLRPLHIDQPARFLDLLEERIAAGAITPWSPAPLTMADLDAAARFKGPD